MDNGSYVEEQVHVKWGIDVPCFILHKYFGETLDESRISSYNKSVIRKNDDEDSRIYLKGTASWGWCEPDASRICLNITSELQCRTGQKFLLSDAGFLPLRRTHMLV